MILFSIPEILQKILEEALKDSMLYILQNSFNVIFSFLLPQVIMLYSLVYSDKPEKTVESILKEIKIIVV